MAISRALLFVLVGVVPAVAQHQIERCNVYVVDVAKARKADANFHETRDREKDLKVLAIGSTDFEPFTTSFREEEATTKHFHVSGTRDYITATVYYTDESMASPGRGDIEVNDQSIELAVVVGLRPYANALGVPGAAITEATYDSSRKVLRAKKFVKLRGREYLVGVQCECNAQEPTPKGMKPN